LKEVDSQIEGGGEEDRTKNSCGIGYEERNEKVRHRERDRKNTNKTITARRGGGEREREMRKYVESGEKGTLSDGQAGCSEYIEK